MSSDYDDIKGIDYSQLRKYKRYDLHLPCLVKSCENEKEVYHSLLTTISVGGVSFVNQELLDKSKFYIVSFKMPNGSSVVKKIEVRWEEAEVVEFTHEGRVYKGFDHGCKFVVVTPTNAEHENESGEEKIVEQEQQEEVAEVEKPETFKNCQYHLEFLRDGGSNVRHGYVNRLGDKSLFFHTLTPLRQNEIVDSNIIRIEEDELAEQREKLLISEITKEGRQYSVKAMILD